MKLHHTILLGLALLSFTPGADAQLLGRWFGPKGGDKNPPANAAQPDPRRVTEVNVEIAWLADPVTFPYYLEARATATQLEVRGYVPSKSVREQALRIAQAYSSLPVADSMKEHASLLVRPSQMSPQQLQNNVNTSLRLALPKQHQQLKAECGADGKVQVVGTVSSYEEKMAVSHALRRLHGCTSVQNLTSLAGDLAEWTPIVKTSNQKPMVAQEQKAKPWWPFGKAPTTTEEPPLLDGFKPNIKAPALVANKKAAGPMLISNSAEPKKDVVKVESPGPAPTTARELQKRIKSAFPQVKSVEVEFFSAQDVRITLELATENELKATAERVFALPELQNYRPELQFKISAP